MREEDRNIVESYLNQSAIGTMQQRNSNNDKYRPGDDLQNSNLDQFSGLTGRGKANAGGIMSSVDLASDNEGEVYGYIDLKHEDTLATPSNPSILITGYGRVNLTALTDNIRRDLADLSKAPILAINAKIGDPDSVLVHKVKALNQVMQQMASPQYKRKITLASRRA
jgi:hypothetical protein